MGKHCKRKRTSPAVRWTRHTVAAGAAVFTVGLAALGLLTNEDPAQATTPAAAQAAEHDGDEPTAFSLQASQLLAALTAAHVNVAGREDASVDIAAQACHSSAPTDMLAQSVQALFPNLTASDAATFLSLARAHCPPNQRGES